MRDSAPSPSNRGGEFGNEPFTMTAESARAVPQSTAGCEPVTGGAHGLSVRLSRL